MLTLINKNPCYELSYDDSKNRIYWTIIGFWKGVSAVPNYLSDWEKALNLTAPGFTILADLREMKPWTNEIKELNAKQQEIIVSRGVKKVATVMAEMITKLNIASSTEQAGMASLTQDFTDMKLAEDWLNK